MVTGGRRSVVVELAVDLPPTSGLTRAQRIAELQRATDEVKHRFLSKVDELRRIDRDIEVQSRDTIFPVLVVTATSDAIDALADMPGVVSITDNPDAWYTFP
ncbi:hypothetical protein [Sorangium sp. So ce394]|uniref:hypothetical protein n=1 Tax=Sorangium sp. So ce394 TaxID=3133310 RepID=UPI003F5B82B4